MITPSIRVCGLASISGMSLQVPGSDSSALTTRYFGLGLSCGMKPHFMPVGKPAPPRPRRLGLLDLLDDGVRGHAERLLQGVVPAARLVRRQGPAALDVPVVGEDRGQCVSHFHPRAPSSPCSRAIFRPTRLAGPAAGPSSARSSGKPASTRSASRQVHSLRAAGGVDVLALAQVVDQLGRGLRGHVVHELPVDDHHRGVVARGIALDVLERDLAVVGRLVVADVEVVLEPFEDDVATHHRAQRVGADADVVVADGLALVHRVERRDSAHVGGADVRGSSAQASMPSGVIRPSTACTRCSIGSSPDRACG